VGVTRGILVELDNEAELAALLGHELGHVNARHAAQRQGQAMIAQVAMTGANIIGSAAGYPASGMVGLQQLLVDQQKSSPGMLQTMFSTHPMSSERRDTARQLAEGKYAASNQRDPGRERFMDSTAELRRIKPCIDACQNGETALAGKQYAKAEEQFRLALKTTPRDYAANVLMAKCLSVQDKDAQALDYARTATRIYPQEAQAHKLLSVLALGQRDPALAYDHLERYDRLLPGNAGITFLKSVALEGMGRQPEAAGQYAAYLRSTRQGKAAEYSQSRLKSWGYLK